MNDTDFIGDPVSQDPYWVMQDMQDNCAVAAQVSVINQFLPDEISLDDANYIAESNGWYSPGGGTPTDDVGNLLDYYGIETHRVENATATELANELQQGHRVIVGVDADKLWDEGPMNDFHNWFIKEVGLDNPEFNPANHAVAVTGIDVSDPSHPMVILNDSGTPNGDSVRYPLDKFMDAWGNSDCFYVATNNAPHINPDLSHFDIGTHLGIGSTISKLGVAINLNDTAGSMVADLVRDADWDQILSSI